MRTRQVRSLALVFCFSKLPLSLPAHTTAIRAGRLIDPATGTAEMNQVILVEGEKIQAVGAEVTIPTGAEVMDLERRARRLDADRQVRGPSSDAGLRSRNVY